LWSQETKEKKEKEIKANLISSEFEEGSTDEENSLNKEVRISNSIINKDLERKRKDEITEEIDLNPVYRRQIMEELVKDNTIVNIDKLIYLFISYLLLLIITLAKGSEHVKSIVGIERY
jgi:uncharacterized membrane protein